MQKVEYRLNSVNGKRYEKGRHRWNMKAVLEAKSSVYKAVKRATDVILSFGALVFLSPVFLICSLAIFMEDQGGVFFTQMRMGKDMKPFRIYKFRSMYQGADKKLKELMLRNEQTGHAFKISDDPRITKVGHVLRRWSLDELPQLFNILKGDMSIVGPRPILEFQMEESDIYERQRVLIKPGLTCYWQIGGRSSIKWDEWVEMDLDYIEDMGLWTDLKIILKTVPSVIRGGGAT